MVSLESESFVARLRTWLIAPRSAQTIVLMLALWLTLTANWALWLRLEHVDGYDGSTAMLVLRFIPLVLFSITALLTLTAWPRWMKPVWIILLLIAASAQYFMTAYGTLMDRGMIHNILQTDARESADLFSPVLLLQLLVVAGLPALWLWFTPVKPARSAGNALLRTLILILVTAGLLGVTTMVSYRDLAPVIRNNLWLRYMFNPVNPVLSAVGTALKPITERKKPFISITAGSTLGASYAGSNKPPLFIVVVGETARSANFSLNGYARPTNPELAKRDVISWRNVQSCGTSTRESVPCMFSHLGREKFYSSPATHDNLLDVLQAAGLAVLWIDNQAGCKGVCERVPEISTSSYLDTEDGKRDCNSEGECLDAMLLSQLDEHIAKLPAEQRDKGVVLVMHQMGSHGPAYYKRSTPETKVFKPECATNALSSCSQESLMNVYDNSIVYTDHFLAQTIDWLKQREDQNQVGMLYVSDHGESLGEMGIYLHGMPYAVAPDEQKDVPMIAWLGNLGQRTRVSQDCLRKQLQRPLTHDNLFHTVLGVMDVSNPNYQKPLDALSNCRSPA